MSNFVKRVRDIMRNDAGINGDAQRIEQIAWMLFLKVYDSKEQDWEWDEEEYQSIIPEKCRWRNWGHDEDGKGMTGDILLDFVNNTLFPTLKNLPVNADTPIKKAIVQTTFADANNYMKDGVLLRQVIGVIDELDLTDYEESHAFGEIYETILKELQRLFRRILHTSCSDRFYGTDDKTTNWRKNGRFCLRYRWIYHKLVKRAKEKG